MRQCRRVYDLEVNVVDQNKLIEAINSHGDDILTISSILHGLVMQLKKTQGNAGLDEALGHAMEMAHSYNANGITKPNLERIKAVFEQPKSI